LYWAESRGAGGRQIRADCTRCGAFIAFLPWTRQNAAEADTRTSRTALLDVLGQAEAENVEIVRRRDGHINLLPVGRASQKLQTLVRQSKRLLLSMLPLTTQEGERHG
jgi:hypothetical protein